MSGFAAQLWWSWLAALWLSALWWSRVWLAAQSLSCLVAQCWTLVGQLLSR